MKDTYTKALLELLGTGEDISQVLDGFKKTLKRRGHERLLVPVLQAVVRVLEAKRADTLVSVVSEADKTKFAETIKATLTELGATAEPEYVVDETLVGGFVAEHNHVRVDRSYKTRLVSLYRSIAK